MTEPKAFDRVLITLEGEVRRHHAGGLCVQVKNDAEVSHSACFKITDDRKVEVLAPEPKWVRGDVIAIGENHVLVRNSLHHWDCTCDDGTEYDLYVTTAWRQGRVEILRKKDAQ